MSANRSWVIISVVVGIAFVAFVGGFFVSRAVSGSSTGTADATTVPAELGVTNVTSTQPSGPTWALPEFDGSVLISGSVGTTVRNSDTSWISDEDGWVSLVIDGTPSYDLGDSTCLDAACDVELNQLVSGGTFVWVTESDTGFSDELIHALAPSGETLAACWSQEYGGPVVAIDNFDGSVIDRAWVLSEHAGSVTWAGLDPSLVDRNDVLPLPFAGYELPTC